MRVQFTVVARFADPVVVVVVIVIVVVNEGLLVKGFFLADPVSTNIASHNIGNSSCYQAAIHIDN